MTRKLVWAGVTVAVGIIAGCSGDGGVDKLDVFKVTGTLTLDGKPFGPTVITLLPMSTDKKHPGRSVKGAVDDGGNISLTSYAVGDGAPAGEYRVVVADTFAPPPKPFPALYRDSQKTSLTVKVEANDENVLKIDMDSKAGPMAKAPKFKQEIDMETQKAGAQ
jgi:hypothetical protein